MPTAVEELQLRIEYMFRDQLKNQHALGKAVVEYGGWTAEHMTRWPRASRQIEGKSLLVESAQIRVQVRFFPVEDLGSFPLDQDPPLGVEIQVHALDGENDAQVPYMEIEAWARAALGREWSAYFYQLSPQSEFSTTKTDTYGFIAIVDRLGLPRLAPDNFDFNRASTLNFSVKPILISDSPARIITSEKSDFDDTTSYRDPDTNPDGTWKIAVLDREEIEDDIFESIQLLISIIEVRGTIDNRFKPISVEIKEGAASLRFNILPTKVVYCYTFDIPGTKELGRGVRISHPSFAYGKMVHSREDWALLQSQKIRREFPHLGKVCK